MTIDKITKSYLDNNKNFIFNHLDDIVMLRCDCIDYADYLCKSKTITDKDYANFTNDTFNDPNYKKIVIGYYYNI